MEARPCPACWSSTPTGLPDNYPTSQSISSAACAPIFKESAGGGDCLPPSPHPPRGPAAAGILTAPHVRSTEPAQAAVQAEAWYRIKVRGCIPVVRCEVWYGSCFRSVPG